MKHKFRTSLLTTCAILGVHNLQATDTISLNCHAGTTMDQQSKTSNIALPTYQIPHQTDIGGTIFTTPNFNIKLDTKYQGKFPGSLLVEPKETIQNWDVFLESSLAIEMKEVLNLCELMLIKGLDHGDRDAANSALTPDGRIKKKLVNFNGEQTIGEDGTSSVFFRLVPRYPQPVTLSNLLDQETLILTDEGFGKAAYFGPQGADHTLPEKYTTALVSHLRKTIDNDFSQWFEEAASPLLKTNFGEADNTFDAHDHPNKAGLCEFTMPSGLKLNLNFDQRSQEQWGRSFLSIIGPKIPAFRFMKDEIMTDVMKIVSIYIKTVCEIRNINPAEMTLKTSSLMNLSTKDPEWHMHLIPSYKVDGEWQRFAKEMFVFNVPGDHVYKPVPVTDMLEYKKAFQNKFIGNLEKSDVTIDWPITL